MRGRESVRARGGGGGGRAKLVPLGGGACMAIHLMEGEGGRQCI